MRAIQNYSEFYQEVPQALALDESVEYHDAISFDDDGV